MLRSYCLVVSWSAKLDAIFKRFLHCVVSWPPVPCLLVLAKCQRWSTSGLDILTTAFFYAKRGLLTAFAFFYILYMLTSSCLVVSWSAKASCYVSAFSALRGFMTASALCVPLLRLSCQRWSVSGLDSVTSAGLKPKQGFGGLLILSIAYVFALSF